jgi:hypothetical protein
MVYKTKNHYNEWEFVYDPIAEQQMMQGGNAANNAGLSGTGTGPVPGTGFGTVSGSNSGSNSGSGSGSGTVTGGNNSSGYPTTPPPNSQ